MNGLVRHLRANAIAYVALFFALTAGAYAATSKFAPRNSVISRSIRNGAVKRQDLAAGAVGSAQIAAGAVGSAELADGSVRAGDLAGDAQPDRDLDLIRVDTIRVDDPADGAIFTRVTLLQYGVFTFRATCQDNGATATISFDMTATESGHVSTSLVSPDDFAANEFQPLAGNTTLSANNTTSSGGYALTSGGRFISLGIFAIGKPSSGGDCLFHLSGWAG